MRTVSIEVFYAIEWNSWAVTEYNAMGDQIGNAEFFPLKSLAVDYAKSLMPTISIGKKYEKVIHANC